MENLLPSFLGGCLIGLSALLLMAANGRIAGISGILADALGRSGRAGSARLFILGLVLGSLVYQALGGGNAPHVEGRGWVWLAAAGLLVGFGARLGSGCTSGHGICGMARLSPRSITATLTFMAAGFATVFVTRHLLGG